MAIKKPVLNQVSVRFSKEEREELKRTGAANGRNLSAEVRFRLFPPNGAK